MSQFQLLSVLFVQAIIRDYYPHSDCDMFYINFFRQSGQIVFIIEYAGDESTSADLELSWRLHKSVSVAAERPEARQLLLLLYHYDSHTRCRGERSGG